MCRFTSAGLVKTSAEIAEPSYLYSPRVWLMMVIAQKQNCLQESKLVACLCLLDSRILVEQIHSFVMCSHWMYPDFMLLEEP